MKRRDLRCACSSRRRAAMLVEKVVVMIEEVVRNRSG
jgi:hypothetical protein